MQAAISTKRLLQGNRANTNAPRAHATYYMDTDSEVPVLQNSASDVDRERQREHGKCVPVTLRAGRSFHPQRKRVIQEHLRVSAPELRGGKSSLTGNGTSTRRVLALGESSMRYTSLKPGKRPQCRKTDALISTTGSKSLPPTNLTSSAAPYSAQKLTNQ